MSKIVTNRPSFQGDICIRRVDNMPKGLKVAEIENGNYIVAHSETGHHHVIDSRTAQMLVDETNAFIAYLSVREPVDLVHLRDHDTHEALHFEPGIYEVRRQREYTPEGFRRVED